ncbi:uncharacterized protein [Miscanthus floridulus]|uniref:uncharacterized protein n=1 Tax=Miscanthus floridulus TaxID=154761 RepID=UPI0034577FBD
MADSVLPKAAWKRPPTDHVKLNCDGAFRQQNRSGGWGFVLRDHDGCILSSGYGRLEKVLEPAHAEVIACLQATQRAVELGIQNIILETDAAAVVQALMATETDRSSASNFVSSNVAHNPGSCNLVAHSLAALGDSLSSDVMSVRDHIPPCIQTLVANDLASVIL